MSQNAGPGFSTTQGIPTVQQPSGQTIPQRIMFNRNYLSSIPGILRFSLIIFQFAAWVSAAAVLKPGYGPDNLPGDILASRGAYLFFSIVGFLLAILFFFLNVMNIVRLGFFNRLRWEYIILATDLLWLIPTFVVSIVAAVRETDAKNLGLASISLGAFGSAAFFGFLCSIIYCVDAAAHLVPIIRGNTNTPPTYAP